jgi:hypothetical protein
MKFFGGWFALVAAVTGIIAAILWWRSTRIDQSFNPEPPPGDVGVDPDGKVLKGYLEDVYRQLFKFSDASKDVAHLNKQAAIFTGISVACSGISSWLTS